MVTAEVSREVELTKDLQIGSTFDHICLTSHLILAASKEGFVNGIITIEVASYSPNELCLDTLKLTSCKEYAPECELTVCK
jgi:hypothetical protein